MVLKSTLFKKPKSFEIIGKGGKKLNPIPAEDTENNVVDTGRAIGGDARHERLVAEVEEKVVLRFTGTRKLLPKDTIVDGSWVCES